MSKRKAGYWTERDKILASWTDEQLRIFRLSIAKELEKRLEKAEKKFFKNPAIGVRQ